MPRFEAVDGSGVHSISEQLASRCGYTISTFKMDGLTTFRASYYSCFTHKQDDSVFTFRFNVMVSDGGGAWISRAVSASCSGLSWTHREIVCEENYMEVNVNRESSCGGQSGESGQAWQAAFSQAQRTATSVWQLMFLQSGGHVSSMSVSEAQTMGYSLTTTAHRVVLRSQYKQQHAKVLMVDGIPVEVIRVSVFFKNKLTVVIMDVTMACTVNSGSFDDTWLLWDVPWIMTPLVEEDARFESQSVRVGVEGVLLDEPTSTTRGFSLVRGGGLVQIGVPFGAEGGYRKSLVVNNVYKELYVIFLLYEHVFSLLYEDGSSITTRHRMVRVLDTPLLCRPPFSRDETISDDDAFSIYLGNIPADVILEEVWINRKQLMTSESINPVAHVNGSRAYKLRLPFDDAIVHLRYLGGGVVQFSIDVNFTLTIVPQRDSYHHHTVVTAHVVDAFPPQISAQCSDGGITFSVVRPHQTKSLWEVGVDQEPLTSQLAAQRGYHLHNDTHRTSLDVPVLSIGYTYEDINLSHFYGIFKLLLRDSKTLEVQTSTSKRCLFRTEDMMVCSADGTMTVVTTPTSTWPTVGPDRISLLDPTCRPKQADGSRVLFEFKVNSCGTRTMIGELYVVYENEIIHDRQLITDGPDLISRESQFKLTVRCFYPLSGVNRLSVDRLFRAEAPGFGSIKVFESLEDSANKVPAHDCWNHNSGHAIKTLINQVHQNPAGGGVLPHPGTRPRPGPEGQDKLVSEISGDLQTFPTLNLFPETQTVQINQVPQQVLSHPGQLMSQTQEPNVARYDQLQNEKYVPAETKHKKNITDSSAQTQESVTNEPTSTATSRADQNLYATGPTEVSSDGTHRTSQQPQDHRGSNTKHVPDKTYFQRTEQGQDVDMLQSAASRRPDGSSDQQGPQQNLVQSGAETGKADGLVSASTLTTGASHIRVRPGPGFSGRLQTHDHSRLQNLQNPDSLTREGTSRTSDPSVTPQRTSKTPVDVQEHKPTDVNAPRHKGQNPTGSAGPGSDLKIHSRSDCVSQYESSVHQGIMRYRH
ncbi:uncharacterized protein LOC118290500 isoform X2 [Scophthalmus maximus]|uniref:uncharacterized protein LOC118290500 isoform X2 n=1 Tax=Scophthalmus maximus TaxID=52904 RepID=UPI001FA93DE9|nr:uncharacterized protein LOC118290500 isoform X2 [Scophthalmus maximus]